MTSIATMFGWCLNTYNTFLIMYRAVFKDDFMRLVSTLLIPLLTLLPQIGQSSIVYMQNPRNIIFLSGYEGEVKIKICKDYSVVRDAIDCISKLGTSVKKLSYQALTEQFFLSTISSNSINSSKIRNNITLFKKFDYIISLKEELKDKEDEMKDVEHFINTFGGDEETNDFRDELSKRITAIKIELPRYKGYKSAESKIRAVIIPIVDQIIDDVAINILSTSRDSGSFSFLTIGAFLNTPSAMWNIKFSEIPSGSFKMGSPTSEAIRNSNNEGLHTVVIGQSYSLMATEVTQDLWTEIMGSNPSFFKGKSHCPAEHKTIKGVDVCSGYPVETMSAQDVDNFIIKLNSESPSMKFRLPTEAEWERAARGGNQYMYSFGDDTTELEDYAWLTANSNGATHKVGDRKPTAYGLFDMHGNVWEIVSDSYSASYSIVSSRNYRVIKGGSHRDAAGKLRSAKRIQHYSTYKYNYVGFRLVRENI
jgi:formylglycine-generating enzyme required for sulfatase activity